METKTKFQIKKEIHDLNEQIKHLKDLLSDYKLMQAGDFKPNEIREEIEDLILERNHLLTSI